MIDRPTPHFLRFVRALAFVSGTAAGLSACSSPPATDDSPDATPYDGQSTGIDVSLQDAYDGHAVGVAPYDAGDVSADAQDATPYDGGPVGIGPLPDAANDSDTIYDGHPVGVVVMLDSGHD